MHICSLVFTAALVSAPALADHAGPTAMGSVGGLNVLGAETLDEGQSSIGFRAVYTRPDQRSNAELEALASQHVHAHNTDYNLNASVGFAFGITHHLTVSAEFPYVRRDGLHEGEHSHVAGETINEVVQLGDVAGIGDMSILAKYGLTHSDQEGFAILGGLKLPTGGTHKKDREGQRLETEHQPGTGSWDPILGAAGGVRLGALQLNGSVLYQFSGKGAQDTRLGDRAQGGLSLSHRFGPSEHHDEEADESHDDHDHLAPHGHRSVDAFIELTGEWEGNQKVGGELEDASGGKSFWLTPGARFNFASGLSIAGAVGVPLWQDIRASHPDNRYRVTLSVGHAL
jgi:hypothetical protein